MTRDMTSEMKDHPVVMIGEAHREERDHMTRMSTQVEEGQNMTKAETMTGRRSIEVTRIVETARGEGQSLSQGQSPDPDLRIESRVVETMTMTLKVAGIKVTLRNRLEGVAHLTKRNILQKRNQSRGQCLISQDQGQVTGINIKTTR